MSPCPNWTCSTPLGHTAGGPAGEKTRAAQDEESVNARKFAPRPHSPKPARRLNGSAHSHTVRLSAGACAGSAGSVPPMHARRVSAFASMADACARTQCAAASAGTGRRTSFRGARLQAARHSTAIPIVAIVPNRRMDELQCTPNDLAFSCERTRRRSGCDDDRRCVRLLQRRVRPQAAGSLGLSRPGCGRRATRASARPRTPAGARPPPRSRWRALRRSAGR
jgi:hypothetical protein